MKKRKIAETVARTYLRYNRGGSLVSFFTSMVKDVAYYGILLDLGYRYLGISIPFPQYVIPFLVFFAILVYYVAGYFDERWGFWKIQNSISSRELTPFFEELDKKVDEISRKMNKRK